MFCRCGGGEIERAGPMKTAEYAQTPGAENRRGAWGAPAEAATACKKELSASDLTAAANVTGSEGIVPGGVQALRDLIADAPTPSIGDHLALPAFLCGVSA